MFNKIWNPILFQGSKKNNYFEGWYFKQVSPDEKTAVSFIPGISLAVGDEHCFIQYIYTGLDENGSRNTKTGYFRYPPEDFIYNDAPFMVSVAHNTFTESDVSVKLTDQNADIDGTIKLGHLCPIKKSLLMPNIMGFFAYIPGMECNHGIISMNHTLQGRLIIDKKEIDFNAGKGYIEKDWGTSFPKRYIWIQCNNFKSRNASVFFSAAEIPWMGKRFLGFICNLVIDKKEYRFATYNNSKLYIERVTAEKAALLLENRDIKLRIEADMNHTGELAAPRKGAMQETIKEGISGEIMVYLYDKHNVKVFEEVGNMAGIEIFDF